jgi:hypothetical protein
VSQAMRVVGVNGINTHGENNVDRVLEACADRGLETVDVRLPKRHWFSARWGGRPDGEKVAAESQEGDILVCHSFGAVRAFHAHKLVEYRAIICIAPAAPARMQWRNPDRVWCYYSAADWAVRIGSWLPRHVFGRAGLSGFSDPRVKNIEVPGAGHSDYFSGTNLREICDRVYSLACL